MQISLITLIKGSVKNYHRQTWSEANMKHRKYISSPPLAPKLPKFVIDPTLLDRLTA